MKSKEFIQKNELKMDRILNELYEGQELLTWPEMCDRLGMKYRGGAGKLTDIRLLAQYCHIESVKEEGKKTKYRVTSMKADIDNVKGYNEAIDICEKMHLDLLESPKILISESNIKCKCQYHNVIREINFGRLRKGNRQFDCCRFPMTHLCASMYLYILDKYPKAEITGNIIDIKEIDKKIILKAEGQLKEPYRDGNAIYYPTSYESWKSRQKILDKIIEIIGAEGINKDKNNWLEAAEYMTQFGEYKPIDERYEDDSMKLDDSGLEAGDHNIDKMFEKFSRTEFAHIVVTNKAKEIIGEFHSYNEIVNQIKAGTFLGLTWYID